MANSRRPTEPNRMIVVEREICYQSPIYLTPLTDEGAIDADGVRSIVTREYAAANISAEEVQTGAVIITGESAKKRNAQAVVEALAKLAGQFVAASAGPHLESVLAGRGSGAAAASRVSAMPICNVDIGGGTTNIALFDGGTPTKTTWLPLGGRVMLLEKPVQLAGASELADSVAEQILDAVTTLMRQEGADAEIWFSGGVGSLMEPEAWRRVSDTEYGDLGVLLAKAVVRRLEANDAIRYRVAPNAIRATVIGAGAHSLQLSGSTISLSAQSLPKVNLPIVRLSDHVTPLALLSDLQEALHVRDIAASQQAFALYLPFRNVMGYEELTAWSREINAAYGALEAIQPYVIICGNDVAAALGQTMRKYSEAEVIVLDGIFDSEGDFIDIGQMLPNMQSVPVVLKDLVFEVG